MSFTQTILCNNQNYYWSLAFRNGILLQFLPLQVNQAYGSGGVVGKRVKLTTSNLLHVSTHNNLSTHIRFSFYITPLKLVR